MPVVGQSALTICPKPLRGIIFPGGLLRGSAVCPPFPIFSKMPLDQSRAAGEQPQKDTATARGVPLAHLRSALRVSPTVLTPWQQDMDGCGPLKRTTPSVRTPREEMLADPGSRSDLEAGFMSQTHYKL